MSSQPCPKSGEGSITLVKAIERSELFGAFYQPELRNKLRHSPCSKQIFVSFAPPQKRKRNKKRVTAILKSFNKRADKSAALAASLLPSHKPTSPPRPSQ